MSMQRFCHTNRYPINRDDVFPTFFVFNTIPYGDPESGALSLLIKVVE